MTTKKSAVPALRLSLGGAPAGWHTVGEHPGLYHPVIAVPIDEPGGDEAWAQRLHDDPGCPLELVHVTDDEAEAGRAAYLAATGHSRRGVLAAVQRASSGAEADRVLAEHAQGRGDE